jgi:hypothetical protein
MRNSGIYDRAGKLRAISEKSRNAPDSGLINGKAGKRRDDRLED